ncbi:hypothetical protein JTB14_002473 [Gonioctena quinquepunctata]|nr:hypothetical protein JTB14_002473 [Gonioctena quinquepunctata]
MSQKINPREVLSYLNELGYVNITAHQLKEFIKDLKKLIKYEQKHKKTSDISTSTGLPDEHRHNDITQEHDKNTNRDLDIFQVLHNRNTVASRARTEGTKEKHITVHITKARSMKEIHNHNDHCIHIREDDNHAKSSTDENELNRPNCPKEGTETECSNTKSLKSSSRQSTVFTQTKPKKPRSSSVIKVVSAKGINRCDPVALYHQYQEEWKKLKFPGQDHHSDLRWAVREKLMSGPTVQVPLRRSSSKRKSDFN